MEELSDYYTEGITFDRVDKMPLTPIGKVDYRYLKQIGEEKMSYDIVKKTKKR